MSKQLACLIACWLSLSACAHRAALRVDCDGPLRPINRPAPSKDSTPAESSHTSSTQLPRPAGEGGHER